MPTATCKKPKSKPEPEHSSYSLLHLPTLDKIAAGRAKFAPGPDGLQLASYGSKEELIVARGDCHYCTAGSLSWNKPVPARSVIALSRNLEKLRMLTLPSARGPKLYVLNGDGDGGVGWEGAVAETLADDIPQAVTTSFRCLSRFLADGKPTLTALVKAVDAGRLVAVDASPDHRKHLTAAEEKAKSPKPPAPGYTRVGIYWHRPASILLRDKSTRRTILLGQDEGSFFGCTVPGNPATLAEAFTALIPSEARVPGVKRQGEWFAVPVKEKDLPPFSKCATGAAITLPRTHPDSNPHELVTYGGVLDARVGPDGVVYFRNGELNHIDHADLQVNGWVKFVVNTATESYSEAGVD